MRVQPVFASQAGVFQGWNLPARLAASLIAASLLGGCGFAAIEQAQTETDDVARQVAALRGDATEPRYSMLRVIERVPYVGLKRQAADPRSALPERFRGDDAITLPLAGIDDPALLARRIEAASGLAVRFVGAAPAGGASHTPVFAGIDRLSPDGGVWTGPLDALLDAWTGPAGYDWRYSPGADENDADATVASQGATGSIEIGRQRSVVFRIHALAGQQRYTASASTSDAASGGDEGSGGNLTSQSISSETEYDPWPEIQAQVAALVSPGARVALAPTSASLLVSGLPRDIERVRAFLSYLNREVLRPVTLSVHVYSVTVEREADYSLGLAASIARLFGTAAQLTLAPESMALIRPTAGGGDTLSATVNALARAGAVSRVLSADIPSLNGKPAQFFELFQEAYLREQRTTVAEGIAQTELVPGTVSSGFAVSYIPRITGPGEVLVRLFASLRDRPVFREFTSDTQTIQLPAYASRAIQVSQKIGRGETLLVTGFSARSAETARSGTFDADLPLPGGGRSASVARTEQVLLITAAIGAPLGIAESPGSAL